MATKKKAPKKPEPEVWAKEPMGCRLLGCLPEEDRDECEETRCPTHPDNVKAGDDDEEAGDGEG